MRRRLGTAALLGAAALLLLAAGRVGSGLRARRDAIQGVRADTVRGRTVHVRARGQAPPPATVTLAAATLGIFRGIAIDYLWMRAVRLGQEGRTFESLQLARWITTLQSRLPEVWAFQAWNLAYNISAAFPPDERWPWVWNGIRLLRDEGLRANPGSLRLCNELAWIFWHKIGGLYDIAHVRYKTMLADCMEAALGGAGDELPALEDAAARAGETLADPSVRAVARRFREAGLDRLETDWVPSKLWPDRYPEAVASLREALAGDGACRRLDLVLRARYLQKTWGMPPARMRALRSRYGPVDFRSPETHALYWAAEGIRRAGPEPTGREVLFLDRMIARCMRALFEHGRLGRSPLPDAPLVFSPDPRLVGHAHQAFLEAAARTPDEADAFRQGDHIFLEDAVATLYAEGARAEAARWFGTLRRLYPHESYEFGLDAFVHFRIAQAVDEVRDDPRRAAALIGPVLANAVRLYAIGQDARADGYVAWARILWRRFQERADLAPARRLPPFEAMLGEAARALIRRLEAGEATRPLAARLRAKLGPGVLEGSGDAAGRKAGNAAGRRGVDGETRGSGERAP